MALGGPFCEQSRRHYGLGLYSVGGVLPMRISGLERLAGREKSVGDTRKEGGALAIPE
jgi:hypothetical protein